MNPHGRLAAVAILIAAALPAQEAGRRIADIAGLRDLDARAPIVVGLHAPGRKTATVAREVASLLEPVHRLEFERILADAHEGLTFAIDVPEQWVGHGLDPDGDFSFSFRDPGGFLGLPQEMTGLIAITDIARLEQLVLEQTKAMDPDAVITRNENPDFATLDAIGWSVFGKRCLLLARDGIPPEEFRARMKARIDALGTVEAIASREPYRVVRKEMTRIADAAVYFRPSHWRIRGGDVTGGDRAAADTKPGGDPGYEGLVALGDDGLDAAIELPVSLRKAMGEATTVDVRTVIGSFAAPDFVLAIRVADPMAVAREFLSWENLSADVGPFAGAFPRPGEALSAGAVAWFSPPGSEVPAHLVLFFVARDADKAGALLVRLRDAFSKAAAGEDGEPGTPRPRQSPDGTAAFELQGPEGPILIAQRGERVFIGDAVDRILEALTGEKRHDTQLVGDQLIEAVLDLAPLLAVLPSKAIVPGGITGRVHLRGRVEDTRGVLSLRREGGDRRASLLAEVIAAAFAFD